MKPAYRVLFACFVLLSDAFSAALAQAPAALDPSQVDSARQRVPAPLPEMRKFDLRLQAPEKSPVPRAIDELEFEVTGVRVVGVTAYPAAELEALFDPLRGQRVRLAQLRAIAEQIEARYRSDDYFLTRVFIPPQRVKDGVFEVRVMEGRIGAVFVEGGSETQRARVQALTQAVLDETPIRLKTLERAILFSDEMPGVGATGLLRPGAQQGESDLVIALSDLSDTRSLSLSNSASNTSGPWGVSLYANFNSPLGFDGQLAVGASRSREPRQSPMAYVRYSRAIWGAGTTLSLGLVASHSEPGRSLEPLEIKSNSISGGPRLRQALLRTRQDSLYLDLALTINRSKSSILGINQTDDRTTVAEATLAWQQLDPDGANQASVSLYRGTGLAGAMGRDAAMASVANFEPKFSKWVQNITRIQKLPNRLSALFNLQTQNTRHILPSGEVVSFGGSGIGRGYDSSAISGDRGAGAIVELRHDSVVKIADTQYALQPYVFADTAMVFSNTTLTKQKLRSSGLGLRVNAGSSLAFDLMYARADLPLQYTSDPKANPRVVFSSSARF